MNSTVKLVEPRALILTSASELEHQLHLCELAGRLCYDSVQKLKESTSHEFLTRLINAHHESVLEHAHISVILTTDRAVSHQLVRHRLASYSQQSQRYCRYEASEEDDEFNDTSHKMTFIDAEWFNDNWMAKEAVLKLYVAAADTYQQLLDYGVKPEQARTVLPNGVHTEICITANVREWRHIFKERLAPAAQMDIKLLMYSILQTLNKAGFGYLFDDIVPDKSIMYHNPPVCIMHKDTMFNPKEYEKPWKKWIEKIKHYIPLTGLFMSGS